jgi:hypothetical protein
VLTGSDKGSARIALFSLAEAPRLFPVFKDFIVGFIKSVLIGILVFQNRRGLQAILRTLRCICPIVHEIVHCLEQVFFQNALAINHKETEATLSLPHGEAPVIALPRSKDSQHRAFRCLGVQREIAGPVSGLRSLPHAEYPQITRRLAVFA